MNVQKAQRKLVFGLIAIGWSVAGIAQYALPWSANRKLAEELSRRRPGINYDEAKVPAYELPDPLKTRRGW